MSDVGNRRRLTQPEAEVSAARSELRLRRMQPGHARLLEQVLAGHRDLALAWSLRLTRAELHQLEESFRQAVGRSVFDIALELHAARTRG